MKISPRLIAIPAALALAAGAYAGGDEHKDHKSAKSADSSEAVATLKSRLGTSARGFEVEDVRTSSTGASCITYRVDKASGTGETRARAVVKGDKVVRSTSGTRDFENAWREHCASDRTASR